MIYTNQLPKIKAEFDSNIKATDLKAVKNWSKLFAADLKEYTAETINRLADLKSIHIYEVLKVTATYFNSYERPVLYFIIEGSTETPGDCAFYEFYADEYGFHSYTYRRS